MHLMQLEDYCVKQSVQMREFKVGYELIVFMDFYCYQKSSMTLVHQTM